jgi:hypothetical protein
MKTFLYAAFLTTLITTGTLVAPSPAIANLYTVNRAWSGSGGNATLTGTLDIPMGSYTLMNQPPSPFFAVDLTLTVNGTPYAVNNVLTHSIRGTGQFSVVASSTALIFSANGDGSNPASLVFSDNLQPYADNRYVIGSNGDPAFEVAYTYAGDVLANVAPSFPVEFGVVIPEPSALALAGLGAAALLIARRRK